LNSNHLQTRFISMPCKRRKKNQIVVGRMFQLGEGGRTGIAAKMRYAFGIPRQGCQRRRIPYAMPQ
jgi:hypothetical protein